MAYVDWMIRGPKISSCNCSYGCPCEFNARPTHGMCEGLEAQRIDEGWFGELRLDGLVIGARYRWPGPVHEGNGVVQGVIDERASAAQREALFAILGGKEQAPTTAFNIYGSTIVKEYDPVFGRLQFECDFAAGTGRFVAPGVMSMALEPIRNPVTGARHPAQVRLPQGFEWRWADMASGRFEGSGEIAFRNADCYAFLTYVAYGPQGVIEALSQPPAAHAT